MRPHRARCPPPQTRPDGIAECGRRDSDICDAPMQHRPPVHAETLQNRPKAYPPMLQNITHCQVWSNLITLHQHLPRSRRTETVQYDRVQHLVMRRRGPKSTRAGFASSHLWQSSPVRRHMNFESAAHTALQWRCVAERKGRRHAPKSRDSYSRACTYMCQA